jgi:ADP-heptose:LPS heptosyltransferase
LKEWRPQSEIAVAVEDRFREIYVDNPDVSEILSPTLGSIRHFRPDVTINLHGGTRSAVLTAASGARWRVGFAHFHPNWIYNIRIPRAQEILGVSRTVHTAEHVASAMFHLGVTKQEIPRALLFASSSSRGPYAVIHPFASAPEKRWPASRFSAVAASLDLKPIFIGTSSDDFEPFSRFSCHRGSLTQTKQLLSGASLFIGNDSGPAHMAAAFGVPSVVLFGPSDEVVWAPWKTDSQVLKRVPLTDLKVEEVMSAISRVRVQV